MVIGTSKRKYEVKLKKNTLSRAYREKELRKAWRTEYAHTERLMHRRNEIDNDDGRLNESRNCQRDINESLKTLGSISTNIDAVHNEGFNGKRAAIVVATVAGVTSVLLELKGHIITGAKKDALKAFFKRI